jgi:hypothetical protein
MHVTRTIRTVLAGALLASVVVVAAACGSPSTVIQSQPSPNASQLLLVTYDNADYGFSIQYPKGYIGAQASPDASSNDPLVFNVAFADPDGATVNGSSIDAVQVSVYRLNQPADQSTVHKRIDDFRPVVGQLVSGLSGLRFSQKLKPVTLNGSEGFKISYTFKIGDTDVAAQSYLIPSGEYAYWATAQVARQDFASVGPEVGSSLATFKLD